MGVESVRIGCGSAYAEDRLDPAIDLVEKGELQFLALDCLAERTLTHAQLRRLEDPNQGYDLRLDAIVREVVARCIHRGTRCVANMGAANPVAAGERTCSLLRELGLSGAKVAVVTGDDVLTQVIRDDLVVRETGKAISEMPNQPISANAYIGAAPIVEALEAGADIVIGGRIADPSLFLGPLWYAHGWGPQEWDLIAAGQIVGHLLECGTYVTGGNWVDPPYRVVEDLWNLGLPIADVASDGSAVISKLAGTGGAVSVENCKAEIVYEIGDPANYLTPDVTVDFTEVKLEAVGPDRVRVRGGKGRPAPESLKVLVGALEGWIGEAEMSFGGLGAVGRAELCAETIMKRLEHDGVKADELRVDYIGMNSVYGAATPQRSEEPWEVRLRIAARSTDKSVVERIAQEVDFNYIIGPAGGGGVRRDVRQVFGLSSVLIPTSKVDTRVELIEV